MIRHETKHQKAVMGVQGNIKPAESSFSSSASRSPFRGLAENSMSKSTYLVRQLTQISS